MKTKMILQILPMAFACSFLLACGGGGSGGGGSSAPNSDNTGNNLNVGPTITSISFVDNDGNANTAIPEGQASIRLTTAENVKDSDLSVNIRLKVGNSEEVEHSVTIPAGRSEITTTLAELGINLPQGTEPVDVAISVIASAGDNYKINIPGGNTPKTFNLIPDQQDELPVISVSSNETRVGEDAGTVGFTFTANKASDSDLTINFSIIESGDMVAPENQGSKTAVLPAKGRSVVYDIPLDDDMEIERDSTITVTVMDGMGYDTATVASDTVLVTDNDVPALPVFALSAGNSANSAFDEGVVGNSIKVTTLRPVSGAISVMVMITVAGGSPISVAVPFSAGSTEESVPLASVIDGLADGATHMITLAIVPTMGSYVVDQNNGVSQTYHVTTVDRTLPSLSITSGSSIVTEGPNVSVTFTVEATNKQSVSRRIPVDLSHSTTGNYFEQDAFDVLQNKAIEVGDRSFQVSIQVHDDHLDEPNGTLTVIIDPNPVLFTVPAPGNSASITIMDNDDPLPVISVIAAQTRVAEAPNLSITFTISSNFSPSAAEGLTVHIAISETRSMISGTPEKTAVIPQNMQSVDVNVAVDNDDVEEAESMITLAVRDMYDHDNDSVTPDIAVTTYTVAETGGSAVVTVTDDDEIVTISGIEAQAKANCHTGTEIIEGCPFDIVVTVGDLTGINWTADLTVNFNFFSVYLGGERKDDKFAGLPTSGTLKRADVGQNSKAVIASIGATCNPAKEGRDAAQGADFSIRLDLAGGTGYKLPAGSLPPLDIFTMINVRPSGKGGVVTTCPTPSTSPSPPRISSQLHQEILPDIFRTTSTHSMNTVSNRMEFSLTNPGSAKVELNGVSSPRGILEMSGSMANEGELNLENIMRGSSFALPLATSDSQIPMVLWGSGFGEDVSNSESSLFEWGGRTSVRQLGFDAAVQNGFLLGLSASSDHSSTNFKHIEHSGTYGVRMTSFSPYLAWSNHDLTTRLKVSTGYGTGEVEIDYEDFHPETAESNQFTILLALSDQLANIHGPLGMRVALALDSEVRMARQFVFSNGGSIAGASLGSRNMQTAIEGTFAKVFPSGSVLSPYVATSADWRGGDIESDISLDLSSGMDYEDVSGFGISGATHMPLTGETGNENLLRGRLTYDSNHDRIGLLFGSAFNFASDDGKLDRNMEIGYGFNPDSNVMFELSNGNGDSAFDLNTSVKW